MIDFAFLLEFLTAILLAWWFNREIPAFANRINKQIYTEYHSLVSQRISYSNFKQESILKEKKSKYTFLFYFLFPVIGLSNQPILGLILIILCFLSVLDMFYYLIDVKYIALIFLLTLYDGNIETFYITIFFFIFIHIFSNIILKKEGFGLGDSLLLIALSPIFSLEEMLMLILIASLLGITYYLVEPLFSQRKREKLPFIPFISTATFIIIYAI